MARPRIACTGPLDSVARDILEGYGDVVTADSNTEEALLPLLEGIVALVVRGDGVANARIIAAAKDLKVIGRTGAGYENVDIAAATARRIPVVYTPGANSRAVAEGAMALMLALCKNLAGWDRQLKRGDWKARFRSNPRDLEGATLGIVGFGRIGRSLAELARPFGMTLLAFDPYASPETARRLGVRLTGIDELMREADVISIHAALTPESKGLIDRRRLSLVKPGSYLLNLARGGIVESHDALHDALVRGTLAGVGLDVFDPEPPDVSHPIFSLPNCLTSPHVHGMTAGAMRRIWTSMAEDVCAVLDGRRPRFTVNPEVFG